MAQHRTKIDKQAAQVRRESQLYSLSALQSSKKSSLGSVSPRNQVTAPPAETGFLQKDLLRTLFSSSIVFLLLAAIVLSLS